MISLQDLNTFGVYSIVSLMPVVIKQGSALKSTIKINNDAMGALFMAEIEEIKLQAVVMAVWLKYPIYKIKAEVKIGYTIQSLFKLTFIMKNKNWKKRQQKSVLAANWEAATAGIKK